MTANISGITVLTIQDLSDLTEKLGVLEHQIDAVGREAEGRAEEIAGRVRVLRSDLNVETARVDKVAANVKSLEEALDSIATQTDRSHDLVARVSAEMVRGADLTDRIATAIRDQTEGEVTRRQELTEALRGLLDQYKVQANVLKASFGDIENRLTRLVQAEQDGTEHIESALELMRDTITQVRSDTQQELTDTIEAVQGFAQVKTARHHQETAVLEKLLDVQGALGTQLQGIQRLADGLAGSSLLAQQYQARRLAEARWHRIRDLNRQAVHLAQRNDTNGAAQLLEEAGKLAPEDPTVRTNRALMSATAKSREAAENDLLAVLAEHPQQVETLNALGLLCLESQRPAAAAAYLELAAQLAPDSAVIWLNLGKAYYLCDRIRQALESWQHVRELDYALIANETVVNIMLDEQACLEGVA